MSDPASNDSLPRHSPTTSSADESSSSDLDPESTRSFFHDRSTILGTLVGVAFPSLAFRTPSQHRHQSPILLLLLLLLLSHGSGRRERGETVMRRKGWKKSRMRDSAAAERRLKWWWLCRDDGCRPTSPGEFLEIERWRRVLRGGGGEWWRHRHGFVRGWEGPAAGGGDGDADAAEGMPDGGICRVAASLTGICSGGVG